MTLIDFVKARLDSPRKTRRNRRSEFAAVDTLEPRLLLTAPTLTDSEQYMVELINRARANPGGEATRYGIGLNDGVAPADTISTAPKQPLAPQQQLITVAGAHSQDMLNRDYFDHDTLGTGVTYDQRVANAGYAWSSVAENIAFAAKQTIVSQTALIDQLHEGLFKSHGHRENMLLTALEEVGVGAKLGSFVWQGVTYQYTEMVTEDFGSRNLNPYITGVVYTDGDSDSFYTIGESIRSGTVTARNVSTDAVFSDNIGNSGTYAFVVPVGTYTVTATFTLNGVTKIFQKPNSVVVGSDNVKVDFETNSGTLVSSAISLASNVTTINENGALTSATMTVTRNGSPAAALTVNLASSSPGNLSVPVSVIIPAGQLSATFTATAVNDGVIDGNQSVNITATASEHESGNRSLTVVDRTYPTLPAGVQTVASSRPTFTWSSISNAATYQVFVNNVTTNEAQVVNVTGVPTNSYTTTIDLPIADYKVWVRGFTIAGLAGPWSPVSVWNLRPRTTVLNSGRTESSDTFSIDWTAIPGASAYDVWINRLTSSTAPYFRHTNVLSNSLIVSNFEVGQYAVWVRAHNSAGDFVTWSPQAIINVSYATAGISVTAASLASTPTLSWLPVAGAAQYHVWINNLSTAASGVVNNAGVSGTSLELTSLPTGSYRAWVRGRNLPGGVSYVWSSAFDFEVRRPGRLKEPNGGGQSPRPVISWTAVAGAVRYEIWLGNLNTGRREISETNLPSTSYIPSADLISGNSYRVWIRAFDSSDTASAWSLPATFTVASNVPESPVLNPQLSPLEEPALELAFATADSWLHDADDESSAARIDDSADSWEQRVEQADMNAIDASPEQQIYHPSLFGVPGWLSVDFACDMDC